MPPAACLMPESGGFSGGVYRNDCTIKAGTLLQPAFGFFAEIAIPVSKQDGMQVG